MNLLSLLTRSPVLEILIRWTALLALGWSVHWLLRRAHPRWRLILWRSILCFGLVLPALHVLPIPVLKIPIRNFTGSNTAAAQLLSRTSGNATQPVPLATRTSEKSVAVDATMNSTTSSASQPYKKPVSWENVLLVIWTSGCALGTLRLVRINIQLSRLRKNSRVAEPAFQELARKIQTQLKVHQAPRIRISDTVQSPFVFGLWQPTIMLPKTLVHKLSPGEAAALLSHEIAHLRQHDLFWCVAWRWLNVVCWFHPLVWKVPAAHNLACEQEADRIAVGEVENRDSYAQLLARLALRVLALPPVETKLTVNGSSQIARRLRHLAQKKMGIWKWKHSVAGFGTVGMLFLLAAGCEFSKSNAPGLKNPTTSEFKKVLVVVQDENGKPIEGATILPTGFRVKGIHGADAYGWIKKLFGPPEKAFTDSEGKAFVKYPVEGIPEEKEFTGKLLFGVSHPEFASVFIQSYSVDSPEQPIQLTRGIPLEVSGYYGNDHQPVVELVPNLSEGVPPEDWQKEGNGVFVFHKLSPGGHLLQLMGRLPSGEIIYSDTVAFTAEKGKPCHFAMEMKPGFRLEGRLDDNVPRPVKNARVMIDVRPKEYPALDVIEDYYAADQKYGGRNFWHSYRPINEDGTFVIESVPPGTADVVVLGDGFASKTIGQLQNRVNGALVKGSAMAIPQEFPLVSPVTKIEVATEPTATLEFTAITKSGRPIEGVWVGMSPSAFRMWGSFGWMKNSSEEPFREIPHLSDPVFSGQTDKNGKLILKNIPAETRGIEIAHPQFQVPLQDINGWRDRHVRAVFSPGMTNELKLTLEPKGTDFIGSSR
jgi:beta-lactamase regulating signal transducer with metallopeptidase domain